MLRNQHDVYVLPKAVIAISCINTEVVTPLLNSCIIVLLVYSVFAFIKPYESLF